MLEVKENLIFGYRCDGTMLPEYHFIKVYDSGKIIIKKGSLIESRSARKSQTISKDDVIQIKKIISDNDDIFKIDRIEDNNIMFFDGVDDTFVFSDGKRKNIIKIDNFWERGRSKDIDKMPNLALLTIVYREIRKILIKAGVDKKYI